MTKRHYVVPPLKQTGLRRWLERLKLSGETPGRIDTVPIDRRLAPDRAEQRPMQKGRKQRMGLERLVEPGHWAGGSPLGREPIRIRQRGKVAARLAVVRRHRQTNRCRSPATRGLSRVMVVSGIG